MTVSTIGNSYCKIKMAHMVCRWVPSVTHGDFYPFNLRQRDGLSKLFFQSKATCVGSSVLVPRLGYKKKKKLVSMGTRGYPVG